ncbi:MAG: LysR family transcriptional regulator [Boseongicola sp.]|nr:LysR family transcriptional regulator [Boseongicola sp.]MDD9978421.1 LysR family transcriptional regulator [Boseongicola sp.]
MEKFDILSIDGQKLRILATIYETGSVSRTAELFDLNQSTISHTLERLRQAIGDPLFIKEGRGIVPTDKAVTIMPRVLEIVGALEGLALADNYNPAEDSMPLKLAIPTPALLPETKSIFLRLVEEAPQMRLDLKRLAPREALVKMLNDQEVDLAITIAHERYPTSLRHMSLHDDDLVVFYDPNCREPITTVEEYANAQHAVVTFGGNSASVVETALHKIGLGRQVSFVAPTASMLGSFIKGTELIATMPSRLFNAGYGALAYSEPPFPLPKLSYDLVWHRRGEDSGRNRWLRGVVLDSIGD